MNSTIAADLLELRARFEAWLTKLNRLKMSKLNSALTRSLKRTSRAIRISKVVKPGPSSVFRPRIPGRGAPCRNAR